MFCMVSVAEPLAARVQTRLQKTSEVTIYILHASRLGARAAVRVRLRPRLGSCLGLWGLCSVPRLCA